MQSPRFNLDDVNDSIVIFFSSLFSDGRVEEGWGGIGDEEGTRCLVLVV